METPKLDTASPPLSAGSAGLSGSGTFLRLASDLHGVPRHQTLAQARKALQPWPIIGAKQTKEALSDRGQEHDAGVALYRRQLVRHGSSLVGHETGLSCAIICAAPDEMVCCYQTLPARAAIIFILQSCAMQVGGALG